MENYYVYRFLSELGEVVYVGKTKQALEKRMRYHFGNSGHLRKEHISKVAKIEYLDLSSRIDMDIAELHYINKWKPLFNTQAKYDESVSLESRENDIWMCFEFNFETDQTIDIPPKLRVDVIFTEADSDVIEFLFSNDMPKATQIKTALRTQMQRKQDEQLDDRIKRLLYDTISSIGASSPGDYKQEWLHEKAEKERLADELEALRDSLRQLVPSE